MKQRTTVIAVVVVVAILGGVYIPSQYLQLVCCASPKPSSQSTQPGQTNTPPAITPDIALLFYYFQLNGTEGSLLVVLQNIGSLNTSVSYVNFDGSQFKNSSTVLDKGCASWGIGLECKITLVFGPGSLPPPANGSTHSFAVAVAGGNRFQYIVTAGEERANCGLAHC